MEATFTIAPPPASDRGAVACEGHRRCPADPAARAGDQTDLPSIRPGSRTVARHRRPVSVRADVGLLYAPFDDLDGLAHEILHTEDRVVIVPRHHRLAERTSVRMSDLEGETLPYRKGLPGDEGTGPAVSDVVQMMHMISVNRMIAILPRSLVENTPADLVCIPVSDAPPSHLVLAWNEQDHRPSVTSFVAAALRACPRDTRMHTETPVPQ